MKPMCGSCAYIPKGSAVESETPCKIDCWSENKLARIPPDFVKYISPITPLQSSAHCANCRLSYAIQVKFFQLNQYCGGFKMKYSFGFP